MRSDGSQGDAWHTLLSGNIALNIFCQFFSLPGYTLQVTTEFHALLDKIMCRIYTNHAGVQLQQIGPRIHPTDGQITVAEEGGDVS